jgi:hypothetical protein
MASEFDLYQNFGCPIHTSHPCDPRSPSHPVLESQDVSQSRNHDELHAEHQLLEVLAKHWKSADESRIVLVL